MKGYSEQQMEAVTGTANYRDTLEAFRFAVQKEFKKLCPRSDWKDYFLPEEPVEVLLAEECLSGNEPLPALQNVLKRLGRY